MLTHDVLCGHLPIVQHTLPLAILRFVEEQVARADVAMEIARFASLLMGYNGTWSVLHRKNHRNVCTLNAVENSSD